MAAAGAGEGENTSIGALAVSATANGPLARAASKSRHLGYMTAGGIEKGKAGKHTLAREFLDRGAPLEVALAVCVKGALWRRNNLETFAAGTPTSLAG